MLAKRGLLGIGLASEQLQGQMTRFLEFHKAVYNTALLRPKSHWAIDLPQQLVRDGMLLDSFVIERQHLLVKRVAEHTKNLARYDEGVLSSTLVVQLREAKESVMGDGLLGRTQLLQGFPGVLVARRMTIHSCDLQVDEIVCRGRDAAKIAACAKDGDALLLLVEPLTFVEDVTEHGTRFRFDPRPGLRVWRAVDVALCLAWSPAPDGSALVLRV